MSEHRRKQKISIVIEDCDGEPIEEKGGRLAYPFRLYLEGDTERLKDNSIPNEELSAVEFWSSRLFHLVIQEMRKANAITSSQRLDIN